MTPLVGGKSGKKLVTIGAAALKKSVNGKLPESSSQKDETFDGLHLLMDFDPDQRPTYSYALMTRFAILGSPYKSLSLGEIYMMLEAKFPYFAKDESKWRDSIRYNLSSNNWFIKTKRALHQPGIGNLWRVDEESLGGEPFLFSARSLHLI
jgi:Forkhead domain